jgi:hypothetical protein
MTFCLTYAIMAEEKEKKQMIHLKRLSNEYQQHLQKGAPFDGFRCKKRISSNERRFAQRSLERPGQIDE